MTSPSPTILELADLYAKAYFMGRGEDARKTLQAAIIRQETDAFQAELRLKAEVKSLEEMLDESIAQHAETQESERAALMRLKAVTTECQLTKDICNAQLAPVTAERDAVLARLATLRQRALSETQIELGVMALLQYTSSELDSLSQKLYKTYSDDVTRVYMALTAQEPST